MLGRAIPMLLVLCAPATALAEEEVRYADPAAWVLPPPDFEQPQRQQGAFALLYRDAQVQIDEAGVHYYEASRTRIQTAEALALGNVGLVWNPAAGGPTVHHLRVIRDGEVIDVLGSVRFTTFQREGALEQSVLDGLLTAHLEIPGLRVGDEVEFAATTTSLDPTVPDHASGAIAMPHLPSPGTYRMRLKWAGDRPLAFAASADIAPLLQAKPGEALVLLDQPDLVQTPEGAPPRFHLARLIDFSDYADWQQVSRRFHPLYAQAATLAPGSELREEAAAIARRHPTPQARAAAALRLVQDQLRYVYVGIAGGNLAPASADETWQRRYGDCKGKTALLLALLAELGIEAEPVVVNLTASDGFDQRLPNPGLFDHVLVRARIDGQSYWLDGTRQGDARLLTTPPEPFRFVLPLTAPGADLEQVPFQAPLEPTEITLNKIDATAGIDQPVRYELTRILRNSPALQIRTGLQALPAGADEAALRQIFGEGTQWLQLDSVGWRYDDERGALVLTASGTQKFDWDEADEWAITSLPIPGAGFYPPAERRRSVGQDADAPWANEPTRYSCHVTTITLPKSGSGRSWEHNVKAMNRQIGGVAYWRMAELRDNAVRTVMASRTLLDEIDSAAAQAANDQIDGFDNASGSVALRRTAIDGPQLAAEGFGSVPSVEEVDWLADSSACRAPG